MSARSYNLNPEQARQANTNNRITETGRYVGRFTKAESVTSKQGTEGIEFSFESNEGQTVDYLTLWTINKDGKEIFGLKMVNAIMTCLRVKTMSEQQAMIEKFENGSKQKVSATVFPELMNKPIGVLLQREEYEKKDGSVGSKMNIYACFDAASNKTAAEILDNAPAEQLDKIAGALRDKPIQARAQTQSSPAVQREAGSDFADFESDLPF